MSLHIIKLCVGADSLSDLESWQQQYVDRLKRLRQPVELMHVTRNTPKRAQEVLAGGSLYWVIKGWLCARQPLLELRALERDGVPYCGLVYAPELIRVVPRPHRPFQGWRYLEAKDAPPDMAIGEAQDDMPEHVLRELAELGLL